MTDLTNVINAKGGDKRGDKRSLKKKVWDVDNPYPEDISMIQMFRQPDKYSTVDMAKARGVSRQRVWQLLALYGLTSDDRDRPDVQRRKARDVEILKFIQANPTMLKKDMCKALNISLQTLNRVGTENGIDRRAQHHAHIVEVIKANPKMLQKPLCDILNICPATLVRVAKANGIDLKERFIQWQRDTFPNNRTKVSTGDDSVL